MNDVVLDFSDAEWMSMIDGDREGLPRCCANISALRDNIISAARNSGRVDMFSVSQFKRALGWVVGGHDIAGIPVMVKLCAQLGVEMSQPHVPMEVDEGG